MSIDLAPYRSHNAGLGRLLRVHRMDRWAAAKEPLISALAFSVGWAGSQLLRGSSAFRFLLFSMPIPLCFTALRYFWRIRGVRRVAVHENGIEFGEGPSAREIHYDAIRTVVTQASWIALVLVSGERLYVGWSDQREALIGAIRQSTPRLPE